MKAEYTKYNPERQQRSGLYFDPETRDPGPGTINQLSAGSKKEQKKPRFYDRGLDDLPDSLTLKVQ
jgi:hypothetical protein